MQKKCSIFIVLLSLLLLFLSMYDKNQQFLSLIPPYAPAEPANIPEKTTYTGKDFSITSKGKVPSSLHAKAYCLLDADTEQVLYGKDSDKKMPMASTTKIMTCIIALENGKLNDTVTASAYAASMPDVQLNMKEGETFYLKDLLYSLMLESHNDTAVAIAEHIGGSVEKFAAMMNAKAAELGCTHTNFVTPNGLDSQEHYTTAKELCIIAAYAIKNKTFLKIIQTPSHQFSNRKGTGKYQLRNHDAFLTSYPGAIGIKTGFTGNAGYCFCGAAKKGKQTLITSVLACGWPPNKSWKWKDTKALMDYGFQNFQNITLTPHRLPSSLPVTDGTKNTLCIQSSAPKKLTFTLQEKDTIVREITLPKSFLAPVRKGDIVGYEKYYKNKTLLYEFPILAKESCKTRGLSYYQNLIKKLFLH